MYSFLGFEKAKIYTRNKCIKEKLIRRSLKGSLSCFLGPALTLWAEIEQDPEKKRFFFACLHVKKTKKVSFFCRMGCRQA